MHTVIIKGSKLPKRIIASKPNEYVKKKKEIFISKVTKLA